MGEIIDLLVDISKNILTIFRNIINKIKEKIENWIKTNDNSEYGWEIKQKIINELKPYDRTSFLKRIFLFITRKKDKKIYKYMINTTNKIYLTTNQTKAQLEYNKEKNKETIFNPVSVLILTNKQSIETFETILDYIDNEDIITLKKIYEKVKKRKDLLFEKYPRHTIESIELQEK